jgi:hypothetical protein
MSHGFQKIENHLIYSNVTLRESHIEQVFTLLSRDPEITALEFIDCTFVDTADLYLSLYINNSNIEEFVITGCKFISDQMEDIDELFNRASLKNLDDVEEDLDDLINAVGRSNLNSQKNDGLAVVLDGVSAMSNLKSLVLENIKLNKSAIMNLYKIILMPTLRNIRLIRVSLNDRDLFNLSSAFKQNENLRDINLFDNNITSVDLVLDIVRSNRRIKNFRVTYDNNQGQDLINRTIKEHNAYANWDLNNAEDISKDHCSICSEKFKRGDTIATHSIKDHGCGANMHINCLIAYHNQKGSNRCPICKREFGK